MSFFTDNLKTFRKEKKLTQKELAKQIGIKQNSYSDWETGKNEPNFESMKKIAQILGVTPNDLLLEPNWNEFTKKYPDKTTYSKIDWIPYRQLNLENYQEIINDKEKRDILKKSLLCVYLNNENIFDIHSYLIKKWKLSEKEINHLNTIFLEVEKYHYLR